MTRTEANREKEQVRPSIQRTLNPWIVVGVILLLLLALLVIERHIHQTIEAPTEVVEKVIMSR